MGVRYGALHFCPVPSARDVCNSVLQTPPLFLCGHGRVDQRMREYVPLGLIAWGVKSAVQLIF